MVLQYMNVGPQEFLRYWLSERSSAALLDCVMDEIPLTQSIFDRVVNTAITLAELPTSVKLADPKVADMTAVKILSQEGA